ncbi:hypothetical protein E3N88_10262 [Mikania micrantha]|uniref:Alpha/beta hydrolase fold-3 domain-containing protein n=1 Tax=Mikania micrantha TaxID=192012 RepID=A0A5N6PA03_9ASTR|nr:hypothetical protein E3N88_10262 [Mikania micrantha]
MSDQTLSSNENQPFIKLNPDGSYTRTLSYPRSQPTADQDSNTPVLTKDLAINDVNKTWARIHIPKESLATTGPMAVKLPLVVYYHGGGFVLSNADSTVTHDLCDHLAEKLLAVVVNVDYRLAPEHRLPAAYDDGVEALHWIKKTNDPWLTNFADFSNCYLMGTSAGANLAYHAGLRLSQQLVDLDPLEIKGLILHSPFIGGVGRTESEIRLDTDGTQQLTTSVTDLMWDLALPVDSTRDHEYCNLLMGGSLDSMGRIKDVGWRMMVTGRYSDLMIDRQMGFVKSLELKGVECKCFYGEGEHGVEYFDKSKATELSDEISSFMSSIHVNKHERC